MKESEFHYCRGGDIVYASCKFCQKQMNDLIHLDSLGNKPPDDIPSYIYEGGVSGENLL